MNKASIQFKSGNTLEAIRTNRLYVFAMFIVAALFIQAQYASIEHATEHPFHAEEDSCEVFFAIEKTEKIAHGFTAWLCLPSFSSETFDFIITLTSALQVMGYQSRAPPALLV